MYTHFQQLFEYDLWANGRILHALVENEVSDEKSISWINHIVNAEIIWTERIQGKKHTVAPGLIRPLREVAPAMYTVHQQLRELVEPYMDYAREIAYQNSRGEQYSNTVRDIFTHIINHSTHHRAQIAARLREIGIAPPGTDYIFFVRDAAPERLP